MWNVNDVEASSSYAVIDANTGRLLEGSNANTELPIASLTKVWTALTVLDNVSLDDEITISNAAATQEGSSLYLKAGEVWTVESLLYGLLLQSGNDAAYALAEHTGGSMEGFTKLMNEKIQLAGLENSHFTNPSGLHQDEHYASALDMANMFRLALQNESYTQIASAKTYTPKERSVTWRNKHKLLHFNKYAVAGKTGYTKVAGRTLVTYFEDNGKKVIVVTLNHSNDWNTHSSLAANVFRTYDNVKVVEKGKYRLLDKQIIEVKKDYFLLLKKEEKDATKNVLMIPRKSSEKKPYLWNVTINNEIALKFNVMKIK
ncbi:D-alanyl-D-alanine carboxypeptidase family protein [Psychrobacillus psychrodurans]|uniref:D-alanyl-D-alanine carboxypeptidase family protein n=1 Tax=Psychrobacillus psychrodurans TaxID=126157 RepID=UPI0022B98312|nr:D-alanyl-D-alanine carboxypeptidase family protein [Psychrobacillus psychrodurans]MCZ8540139.1 D-alanyl-D-alanine carboxypeptidase [Psychrobacillus psychrodurans]